MIDADRWWRSLLEILARHADDPAGERAAVDEFARVHADISTPGGTMNSERTTVNLVVGFLGLVVLFGMGIGGYLAIDTKSVPDFIVATTSAAIGALGAMLAKTSSGNEAQAVNVVNENNDPIPVADVPAKPRKRTAKQAGQAAPSLLVLVLVVVLLVLVFAR